MSDPHIRQAQDADADGCARILSDWIDATDWMPRLYSRAQDHAFVSSLIDAGGVWVADVTEEPAGFIECRDGRVSCLYLGANSRGAGIGKELLNQAKSQYSSGIDLWCFTANTGAQRFYKREGFVEIGRTYGDNDEGLPDVHLRWEGTAET